MFVLHLNWSHGTLRIWGEDSGRFAAARVAAISQGAHPYAVPAAEVAAAIAPLVERARAASGDERVGAKGCTEPATLALLLPFAETPSGQLPLPSDRLAATDEVAGFEAEPEEVLAAVEVPAVTLEPRTAFALLRSIEPGAEPYRFTCAVNDADAIAVKCPDM